MGRILSTNKSLLMSLIKKIVNVGPNLAKNIPAANNAASVYDYMGQQNLNSMFINPVNEAEVIRIKKLCKPKDSMDYDDISIHGFFRGLLPRLLNRSFTLSIFQSPRTYSQAK